MKLFDLINPCKLVELFTCYSGGGSGDGSSGVKYDNLERLYGTQQQAASFMLDQAMPNISTTMGNSSAMVSDAMSGSLANTARNRASADAGAAIGTSLQASERSMSKYGAEFNPARMQKASQDAALGGALIKSNAMNKATQWAEDQKWNRNAGLYAQASGTGSGAMQGMSSAGSGLSGIASQQNANDAANAQGYGQFGASMSYGMMKKDGGYIRKPRKGFGARLANGGDAWQSYKAANPVTTSGNSNRRGVNPALSMIYGAAPMLAGKGLKDVMNGKEGDIYKTASKWFKGDKPVSKTPVSETAPAETVPADFVAGNTAGQAAGVGMDAAGSVAASEAAAAGASSFIGSEAATEGVAQATPVAMDSGVTVAETLYAEGGAVSKKPGHGLRFARGGGLFKAMPTVGGMDASSSMAMPKISAMDDKPRVLPKQAQEAAQDSAFHGKTDGMGESSDSDPDGFGKENSDQRHLAGKTTMQVIGRWLGGTYGGVAGSALAEVFHPVGEEVSRTMIRTGDKAGGVGGALVLDPIGTAASGKYSDDELIKGNLAVAAGVPWAGKFLADGGESGEPDQRVDFKPGGDVQGPGTETSDSIPAWLSDGEVVHNADAVKLAGKYAMLEINQAGRDVREGKTTPQQAQQKIGQVMIARGKQLAGGHSVKLADGGDAERLMREMEAKYGVSGKSAPSEPAPQPQPQQKVAEQPKPQTMAERLRSFATGNIDGKMKSLGLKNGGCAVKLAGGGLLGVSLGAGVQQWNRQQQMDQQKQAEVRQDKTMARQEKEWADQDSLNEGIKSAVDAGQIKAAQPYIDQSEKDAQNAAAKSGETWAGPLTQEQRKSIAMAPGLSKMTPSIEYETNLGIADAYRRKGDLAKAEGVSAAAEKKAAGHTVNAIMSRDGKAVRDTYNVFPNGDTPDEITFDNDGKNMLIRRGDKTETMPTTKALLFALSKHDPEGVAKMVQSGELTEEKLHNMANNMQQRMDLGLAKLGLQQEALGLKKQAGNGKTAGNEDDSSFEMLKGHFGKDYALTTGEGNAAKSIPGSQLLPQAMSYYKDIRAGNPNIQPERAVHIARALTESAYGKPDAEFVARPALNDQGVPVVQVMQRGIDRPEITLYGRSSGFSNGVANPHDYIPGGINKWNEEVSNATLKRYGDKAKVASAAAESDDDLAKQIDTAMESFKASNPKATDSELMQRRTAALQSLKNWRSNAQAYVKANNTPKADVPTKQEPFKITDADSAAASKYGVSAPSTSPNYSGAINKVTSAVSSMANAAERNYLNQVVSQLNNGRLQQGDAIATVGKIRSNPQLKSILSDQQIRAIEVAAGQRI